MEKKLYPLYHGTKEINGLSILDNFKNRDQEPFIVDGVVKHSQWLGNGVYFWEDSLEKAKWWSCAVKKESTPFVLTAEVAVDMDSFLNLDLSESQREFEQFVDGVDKLLAENSIDIVDKSRNLDEYNESFSEVVQLYAKFNDKKVIKKTFENKNIHNSSKGKTKVSFPEISAYYTDTQVCVYDQSTIVSLKHVVSI